MKWFIAMLLLVFTTSAVDKLTPEKVNTMIEALSRLDPAVVNGNERLKMVLGQILNATRGETRFVELVKKFGVKGRETDLLDVVIKHPSDPAGVEALGMVLGGEGQKALTAILHGEDAKQAVAVSKALGSSNNQKVIGLLVPLVTETKVHNNVRQEAIKGLVNFEAGAKQILTLAKSGKLPQSAKFTASMALSTVRWDGIKQEAAKVLPLPFGQNAKPLPSISELVNRKGNVANGAKVFFRESVTCARCHKVGDQGIDVGPTLTEIGSKLPKEELYTAILDPSAGISFGYEAWLVTMKDGNVAYGIIESETREEISVKGPTGVTTRHAKKKVKSRVQQSVSLMPPGLHLTMKESELVDLIEYLASLKKR